MSTLIEPAEGLVLRHALTAKLDHVEWRDSGNGEDFTLRGHAAVFNAPSDDLGGFREILAPGAFRSALRRQPDVKLLYGHNADALIPLARTLSGTLELREDTEGLHVWARVAPTTFAKDMRTAMQRGDLDQMSFAFTTNEGGDDWAVTDDGVVVRTIKQDGIRDLFDVSVVAYPAYPQTDASMRSVLEDAAKRGRIPGMEWAANEAVAQQVRDAAGARMSASHLAAFRLRRERANQAHPIL